MCMHDKLLHGFSYTGPTMSLIMRTDPIAKNLIVTMRYFTMRLTLIMRLIVVSDLIVTKSLGVNSGVKSG